MTAVSLRTITDTPKTIASCEEQRVSWLAAGKRAQNLQRQQCKIKETVDAARASDRYGDPLHHLNRGAGLKLFNSCR